MPIGYLATVVLMGSCTLLAVCPPHAKHSSPSSISFWLGFLVNELPFAAFYAVVAATLLAIGQGDVNSPSGWAVVAAAGVTTIGLGVIAWRGLRARPAVEHALDEGLGTEWRGAARRITRGAAGLPGAQHVFDLFHSLRCDTVVNAIEAFTAWARTASVATTVADEAVRGNRRD